MIGWLLAGLSAIPFAILGVELVAGLRPLTSVEPSAGAVPRIAILIPAHDEAIGIGATVETIRAAMPPTASILVIADNCADDTARRARDAGAQVAERTNPSQRGKGYALAFGRDELRADPPAIVIIIDADCIPHSDTVARLAIRANQLRRPVQAINLVDPPEGDGIGRVASFAFRIKNLVRQRGLQRLTGSCLLTGTGMAFPWDLFAGAPLATADSVEDLALGLHFLRAGSAPQLCDGTLVTSPSPPPDGAAAQRTRWEHGFLATATRLAPRMIREGITGRSWAILWIGLHLLVPPLALLMLVGLVAILAIVFLNPAAGLTLLGFYMAAVLLIGIAWTRIGREVLPARLLVRIPLYVLWKVPIYLRLLRGADRRWTRTERD